MKTLYFCAILTLLIASCSKGTSTVVIKVLPTGSPKVEYSGPGIYNFSTANENFALTVTSEGGKNLLNLKGMVAGGASNEVTVSFLSKSTLPFKVVFQGLSGTNDLSLTENNSFVSTTASKGATSYTNLLYIIYTYDR